MQTTNDLPIPPARPRLVDLVAAARARRRSPDGLREVVARRVRYLRAAAASRLRKLVAVRDPAGDEVCAMAHVLRVRARLSPDEQRGFDDLVRDYTETVLATVVNRSEDDAVEALRRQLGSVAITMPSTEAAPAPL